jgi:hypothetical protein
MMWFKCKYNHYQNCDIDEPDTACEGCEYGLKYLESDEDETYHYSNEPCRYDRYSPCEGCGKCSRKR